MRARARSSRPASGPTTMKCASLPIARKRASWEPSAPSCGAGAVMACADAEYLHRTFSPRGGRHGRRDLRSRARAGAIGPRRRDFESRAARRLRRSDRTAQRHRSTRSSRSTSSGAEPRRRAADEALARGDAIGPLHGLPITIKDAIETEGIRSTGGATELTDHVPDADAAGGRRGSRPRARSCSARPTCPGGRVTSRPTTTSSARRTTRGHSTVRPGGSSGGAAAVGRLRVHELRARHRHRRLGAHPVALLRRVRAQAQLRRGPAARLPRPRRRRHDRRRHQRVRPDRPQRRDLDLLLDVLAGPDAGATPSRWRLDLPAARVRRRSPDSASACGSTTPPRRSTASTARCSRAAADRLADSGAKVEEAHPPVDFAEQVELFNTMILPAISPSLDADRPRSRLSGSHRHGCAPRSSAPRCDARGPNGSSTTTCCCAR